MQLERQISEFHTKKILTFSRENYKAWQSVEISVRNTALQAPTTRP